MQRRVRHVTQRIDDRCSIHPKGHEDREEIRQVAVFGGERRDDQPQPESQQLNHHQQHGEKKQVPVGAQMYAFAYEKQIDEHECTELQREAEQLGQHHRRRRHQTREIDLTEQTGIALKRTGHRVEALRKILPKADAAEVEHGLRDIIRRYAGDATENDNVHEHREQRRDEIPAETEDGLLELHRQVAFDEQPNEVLLLPKFLQSHALRITIRRYDSVVICILLTLHYYLSPITYTVSMKLFCTLLKSIKPQSSKMNVKPTL